MAVNPLPLKPCRRCGVGHRNANGYCDGHKALAVGWLQKQKGRTTTQRGYGHAWRVTRGRILKRDKYCCVPCSKKGFVVKADDVDHVIAKEFGGLDEDANLQAICKPCHREKTLSEAIASRKNS